MVTRTLRVIIYYNFSDLTETLIPVHDRRWSGKFLAFPEALSGLVWELHSSPTLPHFPLLISAQPKRPSGDTTQKLLTGSQWLWLSVVSAYSVYHPGQSWTKMTWCANLLSTWCAKTLTKYRFQQSRGIYMMWKKEQPPCIVNYQPQRGGFFAHLLLIH